MEKFLYTSESKEDMEVALNEYITGVRHMVTIYMEKEEKFILKMRSQDEEAEPSKGSSDQG